MWLEQSGQEVERANDRGRRGHGGHISHCRDSGFSCESDAESPWCFQRNDMMRRIFKGLF